MLHNLPSDISVARAKKWALLLNEECDPEALETLDAVAPGHAGTVVLWEDVDRLIKDYQDKKGKPARNALRAKEDGLREHLSMVYQRFLDPDDDRAKNVAIVLNGKPVVAWDPFQTKLSELVANETIETELPDERTASFTARAYILPRREESPDDAAASAAKLRGNDVSHERRPMA